MPLKNNLFKGILSVVFLVTNIAAFATDPLTAVSYVDATRADDSGDRFSWSTAKRTIQAEEKNEPSMAIETAQKQ